MNGKAKLVSPDWFVSGKKGQLGVASNVDDDVLWEELTLV
jgi:hypothetical protein